MTVQADTVLRILDGIIQLFLVSFLFIAQWRVKGYTNSNSLHSPFPLESLPVWISEGKFAQLTTGKTIKRRPSPLCYGLVKVQR